MQSVQRKGYFKVKWQTKSVITNNNNCYTRNFIINHNPSFDQDGHQLSRHEFRPIIILTLQSIVTKMLKVEKFHRIITHCDKTREKRVFPNSTLEYRWWRMANTHQYFLINIIVTEHILTCYRPDYIFRPFDQNTSQFVSQSADI